MTTLDLPVQSTAGSPWNFFGLEALLEAKPNPPRKIIDSKYGPLILDLTHCFLGYVGLKVWALSLELYIVNIVGILRVQIRGPY